MAIEAKAVQRHLRRSTRKLRLVADAVRGMNVEKALNQLQFTKNAGAEDVAKVIKSAAANVRDKFQDDAAENKDLFVKTIFIDEGVTLKRIQPAPQGRAHPIRKRASHITVVVARKEEPKKSDKE
jgi:large subunit ribosomal protein L22